jgi:NhaP-type Na+/H+ or K+/H+ antiporter
VAVVVTVGYRRRVFDGLYVLTEVLAVGLVDGEDASCGLKFRAIVGISDAIVAAKLAQNARPAKHVRTTLRTELISCMMG